ncbi:hypothetical protein HYV49_02355 [Candidatus Pacearchaeota archaeon]|nr:hypothetical protein [Candidatus Pacearchaeota archaeon]
MKKENIKEEVKKEKDKRLNFLKQLGLVFVIVIIATIIDWMTHSLSPRFYVTFEYYRNKIIFSMLWGIVILFVFRKMKNLTGKAFIFAGIIALVLQVKYFLQGYDRFFVFLFMFLHFFMFLAPAWIIFKRYAKYFR